jgi:hypothetical protein
MVHRSMENLKLDKRLAARRGWLDPTEAEAVQKSLPDVAEKAELVAMAGAAESAGGPSGEGGPETPPEVG